MSVVLGRKRTDPALVAAARAVLEILPNRTFAWHVEIVAKKAKIERGLAYRALRWLREQGKVSLEPHDGLWTNRTAL